MNTYKLTVRDTSSGKTHFEKASGRGIEEATESIARPGFEVIGGELFTGGSLGVSAVSKGGEHLGLVALIAGLCSLAFLPLCLAGFVLGGLALDRSGGRHGWGGIALSVLSVVGWVLLVVLTLLKQPIYR